MIPLLAMIISIYCCLRLIEMGLAAYDRSGKELISKGIIDVPCILYFGGAVAIAILCFEIINKGVKAEHQMRLDAQGAEIDRRVEADMKADMKKFNDDLHAKTADILKRQRQVGQPQ